jgi:ABC-type antimicrobial peptide transport system permease subunit
LNLNAAQSPQLVGVDTQRLAAMGAFSFTQGDWSKTAASGLIPAVVDMNTALWGLKKGVGDQIEYSDAQGRRFSVEIVALLASSILQGKVIIPESDFLQRFPDAAGYRFFLVDAPAHKLLSVSELLTSQLEQRGLAMQSAQQRLAAFQAVQNTYIGIFTVLGGLGMVLGTLGMGVLVARHVLERRGELGVMQAMGFSTATLRKMVLAEHLALLVVGTLIGVASAVMAVWPALWSSGSGIPLGFFAWLLPSILTVGASVCYLAVRRAVGGSLLDAIRQE